MIADHNQMVRPIREGLFVMRAERISSLALNERLRTIKSKTLLKLKKYNITFKDKINGIKPTEKTIKETKEIRKPLKPETNELFEFFFFF